MKEARTSLQWFFVITGIFYLCSVLFDPALLGGAGILPPITGYLSPIKTIAMGIDICAAILDIYFGFSLLRFLNPHKVKYVKTFLIVQFIFLLIVDSLRNPIGDSADVAVLVAAAFWTWYLYRSVRRLSIS